MRPRQVCPRKSGTWTFAPSPFLRLSRPSRNPHQKPGIHRWHYHRAQSDLASVLAIAAEASPRLPEAGKQQALAPFRSQLSRSAEGYPEPQALLPLCHQLSLCSCFTYDNPVDEGEHDKTVPVNINTSLLKWTCLEGEDYT